MSYTPFDTSGKVSKAQKQAELEACVRWQQNKNQKDFTFLLKSLQPIINNQLNKYSMGSPVPRAAFKGEVTKLFVKALENFNPNMGTALSTYVHKYLDKLQRFNLQYQNIGRIMSEDIAGKITVYNNRKSFLEDKLNRDPTFSELADDLGWSMKMVQRMDRDLKKDVSIGEGHWVEDTYMASSRFKDKLNYLYMFEAKPTEKLVLEHLFGLGGKKAIERNVDIARMVGITPNRVSQIKSKFAKKMKDI